MGNGPEFNTTKDPGQQGQIRESGKTESGTAQKTSVIPSLSLPKGGGAIRGIGEKFSINPVTGTGSLSIPVFITPGRSGFGPKLTLSYNSGSGNGIFGFGWDISLPSITRKTDKGLPRYLDAEESDEYILSGAEDLVPVADIPGNAGYAIRKYRPRTEGLFARIERWTEKKSGEIFWKSISRDNITTVYGRTENSRIVDPADPGRVFSWLICESYDDKGNAIAYQYKNEDAAGIDPAQIHEKNRTDTVRSTNRYIKYIRYGNKAPHNRGEDLQDRTDWMFEVVFDYGEHDEVPPTTAQVAEWGVRADPFSLYRSGFEVRTYRLCRRILMFHHFPAELVLQDYLVRSMDFSYQESPVASFVTQIAQSGFTWKNGAYRKKSLPPLEFTYSEAVLRDKVETLAPEQLENLPEGLDGSRYQWVDLDGEGISGILSEQGNAWYYKPNLGGGRFGAMEVVTSIPATADLHSGRQQLMDLAGDGQLDLVEFGRPLSGFYERTTDGDWDPFRPFSSLPDIPWDNPNLKFVDLTGDGHADVLISEGETFSWYPSRAETGFGLPESTFLPIDEEKGPRLVFSDGTRSIYLADLSGDGLNDLVRVRNGEICYWPNLGYGKFGAKVTMDNSPVFDTPDLFDQKRVRLVDIDGSGTTDILYLRHDRVDVYLNQSGNRWSAAQPIKQLPPIDDLSSVMTADLFGNGTGCLVWSSPLPGVHPRQVSFIRLMGLRKPHLLESIKNNLGAETSLEYASSTESYLADKAAGKPWITRLPFPVHVVTRVETCDRISRNRFVTRYRYHHGYYDGTEREFRGFGMVEQRDTEEYASLSTSGAFPDASNVDAASHVPPVLTKTWYHTGAFLEAGAISLQMAHEYYGAPDPADKNAFDAFLATLLPDTILPEGLTAAEEREACRALGGSLLRQEIYAEDGTVKQDLPYTVSERNYTVRCLQPCGNNRHAIFFTHPRETLDYHLERNPADPRISHAMTFETDDFGNVLKSATIGYGRLSLDPGLSPADQAKQGATLVTYTDNTVTNPVDSEYDYRTPLPAETRTYELTGFNKTAGNPRFTFKNFLVMENGKIKVANGHVELDCESEIPYESPETADPGKRQRRLIENIRTQYRKNDLNGILSLGTLESLALPGETYKLAFTPGLLAKVYSRRLDKNQPAENLLPDRNSVLGGEGGYQDPDGTGCWWIPSERIFYRPEKSDDSLAELAFAKKHFFLPHRFDDPFGNTTFIAYDSNENDPARNYDLLLTRTIDPLGNTVSAINDYRVLQSSSLTDPNGTVNDVLYDALGLVVAGAVHKGNSGDSLAGVDPDPGQSAITAFFSDPIGRVEEHIGTATSFTVYDIDRYRLLGLPPASAAILRETHASDPVHPDGKKFQVSIGYSDGFGRQIQTKIQAESGPVLVRDAGGNVVLNADSTLQMTDHNVSPRWVGSGWTIYNNKGKPVRQYEPFFSDQSEFEFDIRIGVSPVIFYDPVGRSVATLHPDKTYEKVVFNPWCTETWDANDTVQVPDPSNPPGWLSDPACDPDVGLFFRRLDAGEYRPSWYQLRTDPAYAADAAVHWPNPLTRASETRAAEKAQLHRGTPSRAYSDSLGRAVLTIADNGTFGKYPARTLLDIENNQREVSDAQGRIVARFSYNILGGRIAQESMEAGTRWILKDITGKPVRTWDSRCFDRRMTYDALRRASALYIIGTSGGEILAEQTIYGEDKPDAAATNHRLKSWIVKDTSGVLLTAGYDFKGNPLSTSRQLSVGYTSPPDWRTDVSLEDEIFSGTTSYDALNRPTRIIPFHSNRAGTKVNVIQPAYNDANLLERVDVWLELDQAPDQPLDPATAGYHAVTNINYNAKGQRELIVYGNGVITRYEYDKLTFRMDRMTTERADGLLQDLSYTYDPAGNITGVRDDAIQMIYFNGQVVRPDTDYSYDAIYRLIESHGREHVGQADQPQTTWEDRFRVGLAHPNDGQKMRNYMEFYRYDEVGNFLRFEHQADGDNWVREYSYKEDSQTEPGNMKNNRLTRTILHPNTPNPVTESYTYDIHGNMLSMPHIKEMKWDFKDQLACTDKGSEKVYYTYDASGQRVRKVAVKNDGALIEERIYLGAGFEVFRKRTSTDPRTFERETLHITDDKKRIALIETRTFDKNNDDPAPRRIVRYQHVNHLGSAVLEIDENAAIISYEEYYPFGSTSYQAVRSQTDTPRRYRYTGKERDEETGLYYHGARYYASWLGRWTAADPKGLIDGPDLYVAMRNNPVKHTDPTGTACPPGMSCVDPTTQSGPNIGDVVEYNPNGLGLGKTGPQQCHFACELQENRLYPGYSRQLSGKLKELTVILDPKKHREIDASIRQYLKSINEVRNVGELTRIIKNIRQKWLDAGIPRETVNEILSGAIKTLRDAKQQGKVAVAQTLADLADKTATGTGAKTASTAGSAAKIAGTEAKIAEAEAKIVNTEAKIAKAEAKIAETEARTATKGMGELLPTLGKLGIPVMIGLGILFAPSEVKASVEKNDPVGATLSILSWLPIPVVQEFAAVEKPVWDLTLDVGEKVNDCTKLGFEYDPCSDLALRCQDFVLPEERRTVEECFF